MKSHSFLSVSNLILMAFPQFFLLSWEIFVVFMARKSLAVIKSAFCPENLLIACPTATAEVNYVSKQL
jgi:hypothetical protein